MFGALVVRPVHDDPPEPGEPFTCDNWECPSKWSCARSWARSYEYNAMVLFDDPRWNLPPFYRPYVAPFARSCGRYELDRRREWLAGYCEPMSGSWCCTGCAMPECPRHNNVVPLRAKRA